MSNNGVGVRDTLVRRLAEVEERDRLHRRVAPIVDCIRKMRVEGVADDEIAGLFLRPTTAAGSGAASFNGYTRQVFSDNSNHKPWHGILEYLLPNQFAWPSYRINAWLHEVNDNMTVARSQYVW